jgi:hypothetical protein
MVPGHSWPDIGTAPRHRLSLVDTRVYTIFLSSCGKAFLCALWHSIDPLLKSESKHGFAGLEFNVNTFKIFVTDKC